MRNWLTMFAERMFVELNAALKAEALTEIEMYLRESNYDGGVVRRLVRLKARRDREVKVLFR